ncbi:MAG: hypothetical protein CL477_14380 [Acidobacteria bacterium]|nr:hypothetical protein [Acidobacteriota bacterium]MDP7338696.1 hypothetical protein [Vicinamibacterales bacterium]MDP7480889.1 hypothetical protein [Vicinamibacterales bacterium]MDP7692917.1 hypothetical protein [Vicinamibacterales bacterium]HJN46354.1 hypothetical protein [Vicinamibacterales bacterium]
MSIDRPVPGGSMAVALTLVAASMTVSLGAQPPDGSENLREEVGERFEVTPIRGGIGLLPRERDDGLALIEVRGDRVFIDGSGPFPPERLAAELGADAGVVLRLSYLDSMTQRSVLGLPALTDEELAEFSLGAEPTGSVGPDSPESSPAVPVQPVQPVRPVDDDDDEPAVASRDRRVVYRDIVRVGRRVHVAVDEQVRGDVVVIGGSLRVDGEVRGEITVIGGSAEFGPEAIARREVNIIGGRLTNEPGARFLRGVNDVSFDMIDFDFSDFGGFPRIRLPRPSRQVFRSLDLVGTLVRFAFFGLLGSVVLLVAAGSSERVARRVALEPVKAGFVGFLAQLLFVPLLVTGILLLVVTIIGIPLLVLVPVVLVAALLVMVLGFTGVAQGVGQLFGGGAGHSQRSAFVLLWLGLVIVMAPTLFGEVLGLMGGPFGFFAVMLGITGFVVEYVAWTTGMGAVILNRFDGASPAGPDVPPPPVPELRVETPPQPDLPLSESSPQSPDEPA